MTLPAALATRALDLKIEFRWDGTNWVDETPYVLRAGGTFNMVAPNVPYLSNQQIIQQMKVTLSNKDFRFNPQVSTSVIYPFQERGGAYHVGCRFRMQVDGGAWENLFVGYIKQPSENIAQNTVEFSVWDVGEILRKKFSSPVYIDKKEHELVILYLLKAGLTDGTDFISPAWAAAHAGTEPTIDYSSQIVPYSWLDEEDIWSELGDIAQASGAKIFVDRNGRVNFWKGYRWAKALAAERISYSQYNAITPLYDDKTFYDEIVVEYAERTPTAPLTKLWELPKAKLVLSGKTEDIEARLSTPMLQHEPPQTGVTYEVRYLHGNDANGDAVFTYAADAWNAQIVRFQVTNTGPTPIVLAKYDILGQGLEGQPAEQHKKQIDTPYHDRRLEVRGNPYVQSKWQAETTADFLAWWCKTPKPMYEISGLRGVPTRTLGSRLEVEVNGQAVTGIVYSLEWEAGLKDDGAIVYVQKVKIIADASFLGRSYFVLDVDSLGGAKVLWH